MNTELPISEVRVLVCQADGSWPALPVEESPYYRTLASGGIIHFGVYKYEILAKHSEDSFWNECSYEDFKRMERSIIEEGFYPPPENRIKFAEDGRTALDGQHRLAILRYHYGANLLLNVENNEVVGITVPERLINGTSS